MSTLVFGHKNPDTDSVCSAIAYSHLKNHQNESSQPRVLGEIQKEAMFVLERFDTPPPAILEDVRIQVSDLKYTTVNPIKRKDSLLYAYNKMMDSQLRTIPIVDEEGYLEGIVTMKDIAMEMINGDFYNIKTSISNIINDLGGIPLYPFSDKKIIEGSISVMAFYYKSAQSILTEKDIIIVGDRYDIIEIAIESSVQLILVTGSSEIPEKYIVMAKEKNVPMIKIPKDTYTVTKLFQQCNFISRIMKTDSIMKFTLDNHVEDIKDDIISTNFRNYPVLDSQGKFVGFIGRKHLLNPGKKKVIMVDHNEFTQSAYGIEEAEILEIVDHHKIGGIKTNLPINFMNIPVGSTCTIVYELYKNQEIPIPYNIAGLMLSGIISDTLYFKSPTCTQRDISAVKALNEITRVDLDKFAMDMFKAGTSLDGYSEEEIFFRDFKDFMLRDIKTGISQVFTLDIDDVRKRQDSLMAFMNKLKKDRNYDILILAVTDILNEGSYFFYSSTNENIVANSFDIEEAQGAFAKHIVSRKKQIVPMLSSTLEAMYQK